MPRSENIFKQIDIKKIKPNLASFHAGTNIFDFRTVVFVDVNVITVKHA